MSAMPQIERDRAGMPFPGLSRDVAWSVQSNASSDQKQMQDQALTSVIRGQIEIPGILSPPEQDFTSRSTSTGSVLENRPEHSWPKIYIEFELPSLKCKIKNLLLTASDDTVMGEVLRTRVAFSIAKAGKWLLCLSDGWVLKLELGKGNRYEEEVRDILYRAKIYRKLKYI